MSLLKSWGFNYRTKFLEWIKLDENKNEVINPGKFNTNSTKTLLIASKGKIDSFLTEKIVK